MANIVFLAPDEDMYHMALETLRHAHPDIRIERGLLSAGVRIARKLVEDGVEVIISRGGTASAIKDAGLPVTIVEVPITGFDVIRTVEQAKQYGTRIGVVAFPSMVMGIDCLGPILGVDIRQYIITDEFQAESRVLQAFREGADVVVGGVITGKSAQKHHQPYVLIKSGSEGIAQAAAEAKRIAAARELEKAKASLFRTVLDFAYDGIISVNQDQRITIFNPIAERLTKIDGAAAIGKKITDIWPELGLEKVLTTGRDELGQLLKVSGTRVLCNKVPIVVNGKPVGAVATFQDAGNIQQMEARIRREIYARGHVATFTFEDIVGDSPQIRHTVHIAQEFAQTHSSVLILGETGTGKEVFAQSIHNASARANGPFVAINCAALPSQILESELFGYVGGAFTGASQKGKPGLFELAHGGTIFLDEIAEMDYVTQGKLLRVLQEKKVMRLGSDRVIPVDVRVIAATNQNLSRLVRENKFRADLYYRLNVLRLKLPPLRERGADIIRYAEFFLEKHSAAQNRRLAFTPAALERLARHPWPGNVRELQNTIERIVAVCRQPQVDAGLVAQMLEDDADSGIEVAAADSEKEQIRQALAIAKGKQGEAARLLGVSRSTLWRKMKKLGLR
ncbi:sigma54 specific transcriptional regulator, Fis family [Thermosinus carboxydivorans Nor1]|uniref:Sigma54 specific transcriptional regulator, Fis family n=1 Tax=Thermosinus carboxydivorans Nor1 TaxID=401526 RepID=A1HRA8_9FIRM|nr:sigma-54-dependent Fis family transcriptional regulator [Thermosinus carboxydivorans]EAX47423.1 sigma54 specific transcriptional regulator, Fis family [Thermosinus carboxydivorans Nor1]